jgi:hypothetical protein
MHVNASLRSILRALILSLFATLFACSSTHAPEPDASSADAGAVVFAQDACARALVAFELVDTCASSAFVCPWDAEGPPVDLDSFEGCLDALEESATCDEATLGLATCEAR